MSKPDEHRRAVTPAAYIGRHAAVIGAGISGLTAASALADFFERVTVLERDTLPNGAAPRPGAAQGWHLHTLLLGGQDALCKLYPGLLDDFCRAGAVPIRVNEDIVEEHPL